MFYDDHDYDYYYCIASNDYVYNAYLSASFGIILVLLAKLKVKSKDFILPDWLVDNGNLLESCRE